MKSLKLSKMITCVFLSGLVFLICSETCYSAGKAKEVRFGAYFTSSGGQSSSQAYDFVQALLKLTEEQFGYKTSIERYSSLEDVKDALMKGEIDGGLLWSTQLVEMADAGYEFYPWGTYVIGKKRRASYCLWHRKSDPITKPSEIQDAIYMSSDYSVFNLIQLREYLAQNGIDKPLWSVFKQFKRVPSANSAYLALAMGEADFFWTNDDGDAFLKLLNASVASQLEHRLCTEPIYARAVIALSKKRYSEAQFKEMSENLDYVMNHMTDYEKTYPTLKALNSYLRVAKMKFITAKPNELDTEINLYKKAKKNGWLMETEFIVKKWKEQPSGQPVAIGPDFDFCRLKCDASKEKMACIDSCME